MLDQARVFKLEKILSQIKSLIQKGNIKFGYNKMRKDELLKNYPSIQKVKKNSDGQVKFLSIKV